MLIVYRGHKEKNIKVSSNLSYNLCELDFSVLIIRIVNNWHLGRGCNKRTLQMPDGCRVGNAQI